MERGSVSLVERRVSINAPIGLGRWNPSLKLCPLAPHPISELPRLLPPPLRDSWVVGCSTHPRRAPGLSFASRDPWTLWHGQCSAAWAESCSGGKTIMINVNCTTTYTHATTGHSGFPLSSLLPLHPQTASPPHTACAHPASPRSQWATPHCCRRRRASWCWRRARTSAVTAGASCR